MFKSYLLTSLRALNKERSYAAINILGLAMAIACCAILAQYLHKEISFDKHFENHDLIARITMDVNVNGVSNPFATTSSILAPLFDRAYPDAGELVRLQSLPKLLFISGSTSIYWDDIYIADQNIFDIFTHESLHGDLQMALVEPSSIAVSESFAQTYFGNENPVGRILDTNTRQYTITAVFKDLPPNSHLKYSALLSRNLFEPSSQSIIENATPRALVNGTVYTYIKANSNNGLEGLTGKLNDYFTEFGGEWLGERNMAASFSIQQLSDIHYASEDLAVDLPKGNISNLYGLSAVAIFILAVASINYTNLATARTTSRMKEVGMRKVMGATQRELVTGYLIESLLHAFLALLIGLFLISFITDFTDIGRLFGIERMFDSSAWMQMLPWLLLFSLLIGVAAGVYPAFYLSSYSPGSALTAGGVAKSGGAPITKILVLIQNFVSIAVITCTFLMLLQIRFVSAMPVGFERDNRVIIPLQGADVIEQIPVIRDELLKNPNVLGIAQSAFRPSIAPPGVAENVESANGEMVITPIVEYLVDEYFMDVMGIELSQGRAFSTGFGSDADSAYMVNGALVRELAWKNPLGKRIGGNGTVVGVISDFHFQSLHQEVTPMVLRLFPERDYSTLSAATRNSISSVIIVRVADGRTSSTLDYIREVMEGFDPDHPFEFSFLDDELREYYATESNLAMMAGLFSAICIFISLIGTFGFMALATKQRSREISIRKVLGASIPQIVNLFIRHQTIQVFLAGVLASFVSYVAISSWLRGFAYRTDISLWVFVFSILLVIFISVTTIAIQALLAARSNPAKMLRYGE